MKRNAILMTTLTMFSTAALVLTLFHPGLLTAKTAEPPKGVTPKIQSPKLTADGCELTLVTMTESKDKKTSSYIRMNVKNTTDKAVMITPQVACLVTPASSPMMRSLPVPRELWREDCKITVPANGSAFVDIKKGIPAGSRFNLEFAKKAVSMSGPPAKPMSLPRKFTKVKSFAKNVQTQQ